MVFSASVQDSSQVELLRSFKVDGDVENKLQTVSQGATTESYNVWIDSQKQNVVLDLQPNPDIPVQIMIDKVPLTPIGTTKTELLIEKNTERHVDIELMSLDHLYWKHYHVIIQSRPLAFLQDLKAANAVGGQGFQQTKTSHTFVINR